MMKAYDWMKSARGIFDFQKDWRELRGVRNIIFKSLFLDKNLHEKCNFSSKDCSVWEFNMVL